MHDLKELSNSSALPPEPEAQEKAELEVRDLGSVALARLIEEVRNNEAGELASPTAYNRTYHRHNR